MFSSGCRETDQNDKMNWISLMDDASLDTAHGSRQQNDVQCAFGCVEN